jgi:membrane fusion protein (multidrug efflux system)
MIRENLPLPAVRTASRLRRWRLPLAALVVALLAGGGWMALHPKTSQATESKQAGGDKKGPPKIEVYELGSADTAIVEARPLRITLPLSGSLTPLTQATVKAKIGAEVRETLVEEGVAVQAGQVLARLDSADWQARLNQAQGVLDEAKARLAMARRNAANNETLARQNFISRNSLETTQNSVDLAEASFKSAQSQVELARIALNDTVIRAPISGVVSKRHVRAGEKVSPDVPVYAIVDLRQLTLEAPVPASDIPRVKVGQEVAFQVDGFDKRTFKGRVARINPAAEAGSRALMVYIAVANPDSVLRGGMFAKGTIVTEQTAANPLVQLSALVKGEPLVYRVDNGKVVAQPVKLGMRNEDEGYVEVLSGLDQGANVIVAKLEGIKPGTKVKLAAPAAPATAVAATAKKG